MYHYLFIDFIQFFYESLMNHATAGLILFDKIIIQF